MVTLGPTRMEASRWNGRPRIVCERCGKSAHPTEESARERADAIERKRGAKMSVYLGPECGWWHLATKRR